MSKPSGTRGIETSVSRSLDELARDQGARVVEDVADLAADIWESDAELDEFLADLRASRAEGLA